MINIFDLLKSVVSYPSPEKGRIDRKNYLLAVLSIYGIDIMLFVLIIIFLINKVYIFLFILTLIFIFFSIQGELIMRYLNKKRQHDLGKTTKYFIMVSPRIFLQKGIDGPNEFGEKPSGNITFIKDILDFYTYNKSLSNK